MMNTPSMYSVDQLLKARQNGVPDYVVVPMLQKAMAQKQAMAQQQALQQGMNPPPPVADQILDAAHNDVMQEHMARRAQEEPRGIDSLPSGIDEEDYAGGGIVAFNGEDGSDVPEAEDAPEMDPIELYSQNADRIGVTNAVGGISNKGNVKRQRSMIDSILAERANIEGRHGKTYKEHLADYYGHDKTPEEMTHYLNSSSKYSGIPLDAVIDKNNPDLIKKILQGTARQEQGLINFTPEVQDAILKGAPVAVKGPKGASKIAAASPPTQQGIASLPEAKGSMVFPAAPEDMPMPHSKEEESAAYKAKELQDLLGEDPNAARREARLSKREADLAEEKDRSPWMALMQAGLSTMAGTSPNAFANIGAGATEGLKSYGEARKDISKSSDKLMDLRDEVEAAQRAEQKAIKLKGFESAEAARAANFKTDAENKLRKYTHGKEGADYGQKERELQATSSLRGAQAEEARAKAEYYGGDGAGSRGAKGAMTANQQVNTLKYHDTKLSKQIAALEKDDRLSDEEKQHEIDVRKDRQAQIADIMESIMVGNRIDPAEVLKLNEPFPAYKAPAVQKKSSVWEDIKNFASGPTPQPSKTVADNSKLDALLNKYR